LYGILASNSIIGLLHNPDGEFEGSGGFFVGLPWALFDQAQ
jgi:hypothetical protein